jgi:type IV pilus assembly protein PilC
VNFIYRAFDKAGKAVSDRIEAPSVSEASEALRRQGLFVAAIEAAGVGNGGQRVLGGSMGASGGSRGGKGSKRDVAMFIRQLGVLVSTGTPLVDSMASLEKQLKPGGWRDAVADIRRRIEEGAQLSLALEAHPRLFDPVARSLVAAGESGGHLDKMLKELAQLLRQQVKMRSAILGAMAYPALLIVIAVNVLVIMLLFVLPRFEELFTNLGAPLPPTTRMLMDFSKLLIGYWYVALASVIGVGTGAWYWVRSSSGTRWVHTISVRLPRIGAVVRSLVSARITRVLGVLLEGRVPMLEALQLTRDAAGNMLYADLIKKAEESVVRGETISSALENSPLFSSSIVESIRSGERSGQLPAVLKDISAFMDEDNEVIMRSLASVIEPLILMVLGLVIGFVAISMFLPLFDAAGAAQAGGGR